MTRRPKDASRFAWDLLVGKISDKVRDERYESEQEQHFFPAPANPVYKQGFAVLSGMENIPEKERERFSQMTQRVTQSQLWPPDVRASLQLVTKALYVKMDVAQERWSLAKLYHPTVLSLSVQTHDLESRVRNLEIAYWELAAQLATGKAGELSPTLEAVAEKAAREGRRQGLVEQVEKYADAIARCFTLAFGTPAAVTVAESPIEEELPVSVVLDASAGNARDLAASRALGGRKRFYEAIADVLPERMADLITFTFRFPPDETE